MSIGLPLRFGLSPLLSLPPCALLAAVGQERTSKLFSFGRGRPHKGNDE